MRFALATSLLLLVTSAHALPLPLGKRGVCQTRRGNDVGDGCIWGSRSVEDTGVAQLKKREVCQTRRGKEDDDCIWGD
ncbi:hypothetical protein R3P38DRAFT_3133348 [Favolaschia claudopus]|uniref:Uncharacterized protein n=1 Tax=Favolaschia claudopus TaxID=2862362 RepID=A0AAV9Z996_9AGAR